MTQQNVSDGIKKLGITRKKNLRMLPKGMKRKEQNLTRNSRKKTQKTWFKKSLIPQLQPGNIIIIDNATFHKGQSIKEIVEEAGCEIWYLPPYSPDLNKIERWWSVLKTWMKQRIKEFETVGECVDAAFKKCPNVYP